MNRTLAALVLVAGAVPVGALDFAGLQEAVRRAAPGEVISVPAGDYRGELVVDRSVHLQGEPGARLVHEQGKPGPTVWIRSPGVRLADLTVVGSGTGGRRDQTAVVVTAAATVLTRVTVVGAWSGLWVDQADHVSVAGFRFRGREETPFWQRGDGVRVTDSSGVRLSGLDLKFTGDGVLLEKTVDAQVEAAVVADARYGFHLMFGSDGTLKDVQTRSTVAGLMAMETTGWVVTRGSFTEGYRTGSAGIREIRTHGIRVSQCRVAHQATGIELIDARKGTFSGNSIDENAVAWSWAGDNGGTLVRFNTHRGNLSDASGPPTLPTFDRNLWDGWTGLDLDGDGIGDTPYRFDRTQAAQLAAQPWRGGFLGSPLGVLTRGIPGGEVLDPHPLVGPTSVSVAGRPNGR